MEKKLYWFKFKDDFFDNVKIKKLRKIAGGDTYTIIYLKLQLLSLKNSGYLFYEGIEDSFSKELALKIDEDDDDVEITINFLLKHEMLLETEDDKYILPETIRCIGSESLSSERVRKYREKKKNLLLNQTKEENYNNIIEIEKIAENKSKIGIKDDFLENDLRYTSVTCNKCNVTSNKNVTLDNKIKDNKIEDNKIEDKYSFAYAQIIPFLNEKANTNFRLTTRKTQTLINSRLREGYKVEDFKTVIEKKCEEWKNTDMEKYLNPETLFGTKFEKYLLQKTPKKKVPNWYEGYKQETEKENVNTNIVEEDIDDLNDFFSKGV